MRSVKCQLEAARGYVNDVANGLLISNHAAVDLSNGAAATVKDIDEALAKITNHMEASDEDIT